MFKESNASSVEISQVGGGASIRRKRALGVYFTPDSVSKILCTWAIQRNTDLILEPSFGGCGFLTSAAARLKALGKKTPWGNLYGCDIQHEAFSYLPEVIQTQKEPHFCLSDFLALDPPKWWPRQFDAVVGNPPYVSNHNLSSLKRKTAHKALELTKQSKLPKTASLWAYFVIHSVRYLAPGGRLALVLPRSLLDADYGRAVRAYVASNFQRSVVILIQKQLFKGEGAEERTVCLLADNKGTKSRNIDIPFGEAADEHELRAKVRAWSSRSWQPPVPANRPAFALLTKSERKAFAKIAMHNECKELGQFCKIRIGAVTGANKFFLWSLEQVNEVEAPLYAFVPAVSRSADLGGLAYTDIDFAENLHAGRPCLLLNPTVRTANTAPFRAYLRRYPKESRESNVTFGKRSIWYRPSDKLIPDAFFPYMHDIGPRLCFNFSGSLSTNNIHRVFFKARLPRVRRQAIGLSLLTTFSQLSSELEGRSYGGGVLKHEPNEAVRIRVFLPRTLSTAAVRIAFEAADNCLRRGDWESAREIADKLIFSRRKQKLKPLERALARIRLARRTKQ